jgi:hypothetical protein
LPVQIQVLWGKTQGRSPGRIRYQKFPDILSIDPLRPDIADRVFDQAPEDPQKGRFLIIREYHHPFLLSMFRHDYHNFLANAFASTACVNRSHLRSVDFS